MTHGYRSRSAVALLTGIIALAGTACASTSDGTTAPDEPALATTPAIDQDQAPTETGGDADPTPADTSTSILVDDDDTPTPESDVDTTTAADLVSLGRPAAPNGRDAPEVAAKPAELAGQVAEAEQGLRDDASSATQRADWGHQHQVAIRKLGYEPAWDSSFFEALPSEFQARTLLHVSARRALIDLSSGYDAADFIPAWQIIEPEPADALLSYYQEAEAATGIEWEFLAAINLIETGMGRIRGLSSAGAQGPMQFLPTTWAEAGIGEGDINSPRDAINGAARYLVRRGGPADMQGAIWGYNNSDDYVTAVRAYAELLRQDPSAYEAIYNWEIYFFTEAGDVWLPTGFRSDETLDLYDFLDTNPWSAPDRGLR